MTIIHIYTVLFLDLDRLPDNYSNIHGAISRFRGCCLTIILIYTMLFLDLEGSSGNFPYIQHAISRFIGVG